MKTIILLSYNNYYNRIVKKPLQSASEYRFDGATVILQTSNVNFYENDGVSTQLVVNYEVVDGAHPDYLIVADEVGNVIQRWYVIDSTHLSGNQRRLSLLRDVIADHYFEISTSPMFVEKAMLNTSDPAIFNDEGISVNQILTRKEILADETGCPWIVGYIPKNFPSEETTFDFDFNPEPDESVSVESEATFYSKLGEYVLPEQRIKVGCLYKNIYTNHSDEVTSLYIESTPSAISPSNYYEDTGIWTDGPSFGTYDVYGENHTLYEMATGVMELKFGKYIRGYAQEINSINLKPKSAYNALMSNIPGRKESADNSIVGKILFIESTGEYKIVQKKEYSRKLSIKLDANSGSAWEAFHLLFIRVDDDLHTNTMTASSLNMVCDVVYSSYELVPYMSKGTIRISQDRVHLNDQPYDMFCIPYSDDIYLEFSGIVLEDPFKKDVSMGFAQAISSSLGSSASYDIQILPYCPVPNLFEVIDGKKVMHFKERASNEITTAITQVAGGELVTSAIFWAPSSSFELSIPFEINVPTNSIDMKLIEICDKYRIASPNMSSFFDFSPMKNGGVTSIDVICAYKPYSPYIHLNPRFEGIYASPGVGYEVRGLDLSGNFSLTQTSNAWTDYQLQNKNFENIFNRQMDSLKMQHSVQERFDILNAFTGTVSGAASGGMTGAAAGPWGAVAGAVVGGVASGIGGAMDVNINRMLRQEQVSLQEDIFAYQKGNIQALPNSLTKVDTLSQNNPLIPYIEFYTCTQIEREAVRNILKYSGMTVGRVGTISDFISSEPQYIRGRLIRIDGIQEDFHIVQQISQELQKGVYI